ncbi:MAG: hypothetical protein EXS48_03065 [Candidatus Staskawiczbacteria bacterium]|nr:hypothetical protein [Candidatus Staskawiczbacteria bacterium]
MKHRNIILGLLLLTVFGVSFTEATLVIGAGNAYSQTVKLKTQFAAFLIGPLGEQSLIYNPIIEFLNGPPITGNESPTDNLTTITTETFPTSETSPIVNTLSVNSSGATSVTIASNNSNAYGGPTNYTKSNLTSGIIVILTAPSISGGKNFVNWVGCTSTSGVTCNVTMNAAIGVTAVYAASTNSGPVITTIYPNTAVTGGQGFILTVNGTGFVNNSPTSRSIVNWNGSPRIATDFVSSTQLRVQYVSYSDIQTAGTYPITVTNPGPNGGASNAVNFNVTTTPLKTCFICSYLNLPQCGNADGTDQSTCENMVPAGGSRGDCQWADGACQGRFQKGCINKIQEVGANYDWERSTNYQPPLNSDWPNDCTTRDYYYDGHSASWLCGELFDSVQRCVTGLTTSFPGGIPASLNFVNDGCSTFENQTQATAFAERLRNNLPVGYTVTVTGNQSSSFGTTGTPSCFTNHMTLTITRDRVVTTYQSCKTVVGGVCGTLDQTINCTGANNAVQEVKCCNNTTPPPSKAWFSRAICAIPIITSISPSSRLVGSGAFTMTVTGNNFAPGAVVKFNGLDRVATGSGSTKRTVAILASDVATVETYPITITNPAPDGGTSNSVTFKVNSSELTIVKNATGGNGIFDYLISRDPNPYNVNIFSPQIITSSGLGTFTAGVNPGTTYYVREYISSGWTLASVTCKVDGVSTGTPTTVNSNGVTVGVWNVTVEAGKTTTCTFNNTKNVSYLTIRDMNPEKVGVGSPDLTLTVNGTGFTSRSFVRTQIGNLTTTYVSATQLIAIIPSSHLSFPSLSIVVVKEPGSDAISNSLRFSIIDNESTSTAIPEASSPSNISSQTNNDIKSSTSNNIFSSIWNFIGNIFKIKFW